jgi:phosphatidylinositol phospholipase C epsilon
LQVLHHGSTAVHWEAEGGSRAALVFVRLDRSCATLSWCRPAWSGLKTSNTTAPDYCLGVNPEEGVWGKWGGASGAEPSLEEGFLELSIVKEVVLGARDRDRDPDLANTLRRYSLDNHPTSATCLALVYGTNLSDNRVLYLLSPPALCRYVFFFIQN